MRKAIIENGEVVNIITVPDDWETPDGVTAVDATGALAQAGPGDAWDGQALTKPAPAVREPVVARDFAAELDALDARVAALETAN